ncbi:MAG TPA: ABC transporter substrate-binding protein [Nitrospiria bacterium]|nr:ABC transporter substrate-binding protein [Nitrospiria bacterium]
MDRVHFSLLRGVCQIPAYVAHVKGFFNEEKVPSEINIEPTAWMVPTRLANGDSQFAVIPWTRVATSGEKEIPLVLLCGSGFEEAAIVVRKGIALSDVKRVAVPLRGGMKDLTAMGLIESLGWEDVELFRQPSGDGAIISFFGQGVDAASMVEPYATMLEALGVGVIVKRTGDIWRGAPGCSLTTTVEMKNKHPKVAEGAVRAFVRATRFVLEHPDESAEIAHRYIGLHPRFIRQALQNNRPNVDAIRNQDAMDRVLSLMLKLGYIKKMPSGYTDLSFLDKAASDQKRR